MCEKECSQATRDYIAGVVFDRTASGELETLRRVCEEYGPSGWFDEALNKRYHAMAASFSNPWTREDDTDGEVLRIFAEILGESEDDLIICDDPAITKFPQIARLYDALGLLHQFHDEYRRTTTEKYLAEFRSVVAAAAKACNIDRANIVEELKVGRARVRSDKPSAIL